MTYIPFIITPRIKETKYSLPELHAVPPFPTSVSPADAILPGICVCTFLSSAPMYWAQNCKSVLQDLYTWCAY